MNTSTRLLVSSVALASAVLLSATAPALAKDGDVRTSGACQGSATWKLKASPEDGRIEVEGEVDSNRSGQTWRWTLRRGNGTLLGSGTRTTAGRSGSFEVRRVAGNFSGTDTFVFRAQRPGTQQICRGTVRF
ncbi:MAG: hypothetical protein ABWY19_16020 [Marmoricola sp.]